MTFKTASILSMIWLTFYFIYLVSVKHIATSMVPPSWAEWVVLGVTIVLIVLALLPLPVFHLSSRVTLLTSFLNLIITPFGHMRFREFFLASILTSMVIPVTDTAYMLCYYPFRLWGPKVEHNWCCSFNMFAAPILTLLPFWWRTIQCLSRYVVTSSVEHLVNSMKYALSLTVILVNALHNILDVDEWGPFRILWLVVIIFSTLFNFTWDVTMGWGLLRRGSKHNFLLRDHLMYPIPMYYAAIAFNLVARFAWAGTLSLNFFPEANIEFFRFFFGSVELLRRAVWSLLRVEWEMMCNDEQSRKHEFVPEFVVPIPKYEYQYEAMQNHRSRQQ